MVRVHSGLPFQTIPAVYEAPPRRNSAYLWMPKGHFGPDQFQIRASPFDLFLASDCGAILRSLGIASGWGTLGIGGSD